MCVFSFSIGQHGAVDTDSPLWIAVVNVAALSLLGNDAGSATSSSARVLLE